MDDLEDLYKLDPREAFTDEDQVQALIDGAQLTLLEWQEFDRRVLRRGHAKITAKKNDPR